MTNQIAKTFNLLILKEKQITLIISLQWHLSKGGKRGNYNDLTDFDKGKTEGQKSDKAHFLLHHVDGVVKVFHLCGEDMQPECTIEI